MQMTKGRYFAKPAELQLVPGARYRTTSVGISLVRADSKGRLKLNKAAIRVIGPNTPEGLVDIDRLATLVAKQLNAHVYTGMASVNVDTGKGKAMLAAARATARDGVSSPF